MTKSSKQITRPLTGKYVFALGLLAALAILNFIILRTAILENRRMALIANHSGRQRTLLYRTAMLAERLVFAIDDAERALLRHELTTAIAPLEKTHHSLIPSSSSSHSAAQEVRAIFDNAPWLLDSEVRNYVLHLRSIAKSPNEELNFGNPHFKYVRDRETIDKILGGLEQVVDIYERHSARKTSQLQMLANWSLVSTLVVLLLDGWFVFRPMVRRVRDDVRQLNDLNATLEDRVAERTAVAERRAEQLAQSESALRDSEALYRSLVEHLPMYVLRKNREGRFQFANARLCDLLGKPPEEIVGRADGDFYPPSLAAKYIRDDQQVMRTRSVLRCVEEYRKPDGQNLHVEVLKSPLHDAAGNVIGTQTVFWDVTDRILAEQRAMQAERLAAIGKMVAGVAHESRNALQQIQACSRLLEWELDPTLGPNPGWASKQQDLIADLQSAQDRLRRLFDELREYASPKKPQKRRCNIREVFRQACREVEPMIAGRDVQILEQGQKLSWPAPLAQKNSGSRTVWGDPFQLQQVFRNILDNSLAACEDPVIIEVEYRAVLTGPTAKLQTIVRDNGPGLSAEQQKRIFEPFFTTKTRGTGLGMAIVKQIIEAHRGEIQARSGDPAGTEIAFTLPGLAASDFPSAQKFLEKETSAEDSHG